MIYKKSITPIIGKNIIFREIELTDAEFVLFLRMDEKKGLYLNKTSSDIEVQREYISRYKKQEKQEYYFIIENKLSHPIGTVRIYDIRGDSFCWGSWLLSKDAPLSAGIESALLVYEFAFYELGFFRAHFDVRLGNKKVIEFHKRMGAVIIKENNQDVFFNYQKTDYEKVRPHYERFLKKRS